MSILNIAFCGDSTIQGTVDAPDEGDGGTGSAVEIAAELLGNSPYGPLIGPGVRPAWRGMAAQSGTEWSDAGTWTATATTDAFDKWFFGTQAFYGAHGTGSTATWTKPAGWARPIVAFAVYYVDYTGAGDGSSAGNWSYQIDGGAWTNMGQTVSHDNNLKKLYVAAGVNSTITFRQADASGANAGMLICAVEPYYVNPLTAPQGVIAHDLGRDGNFFVAFVESGSGDELAWFDSCVLQNSAPNHQPSIVLTQFTNDAALFGGITGAQWTAALQTIYNRVHSYATYIPLNVFDQNGRTANLATYRAATKTFVASTPGTYYFDTYDAWSALGITGWSAANAQGFMYDSLHLSPAGHLDQGGRFYWFLRANAVNAGESSPGFNLAPAIGQGQGFAVGAMSLATVALAGRMFTEELGAGADAGEQIALSDTETGTGTDAGETIAITQFPSDSDTGAGDDEGALTNMPFDTDTGAGTDAGEQVAAVTIGVPSGLEGISTPSEELVAVT